MAKMMFENLNAIVANTLTDSIKMIDISELHESKDNFFVIERIEEFAETILGQGGVKDNLIVRPLESGGYEIISGHRRRAAVQYLIDSGENISRYLPCLVQNYADNDSKMLDVVLMNISARKLSDSEMWKSYEIIDGIFKRKKEAGEKFGRLREKVAAMLDISPAQVGKMQNIDKYAIPAVKEAIENGDVSISTANELAKLSESEQKEIAKQDLSGIANKYIANKLTEKVDTNINFQKKKHEPQKGSMSKLNDFNLVVEELNSILDMSDDFPLESHAEVIGKIETLIETLMDKLNDIKET